uniref:Uncharacterized protein n=1 Tax=Mycena chlorophos TaxID=658473 RepID=A0ABQ0KXM1_MYCCL|nr:predicted protein [Mycena chlorophos]
MDSATDDSAETGFRASPRSIPGTAVGNWDSCGGVRRRGDEGVGTIRGTAKQARRVLLAVLHSPQDSAEADRTPCLSAPTATASTRYFTRIPSAAWACSMPFLRPLAETHQPVRSPPVTLLLPYRLLHPPFQWSWRRTLCIEQPPPRSCFVFFRSPLRPTMATSRRDSPKTTATVVIHPILFAPDRRDVDAHTAVALLSVPLSTKRGTSPFPLNLLPRQPVGKTTETMVSSIPTHLFTSVQHSPTIPGHASARHNEEIHLSLVFAISSERLWPRPYPPFIRRGWNPRML